MNYLLTLSGTQLARLIRTRQVSSREVVEAHIRHIRQVNRRLNAVVQDRFEQARGEARRADEQLADADPEALPPFHGVPCTIKESFALEGMPNTSGLVARRGVIAREDATTVARLRRAGAIPLGVTNIPELCMWMETHNRIYGRTNNAYNPRRIAGGSSGGEGAIIGAGGSPFGLGADIGGSIRMPAFFNGIFGHKPTGGLVPGTGQYPIASAEALRYLATGPLARRAEDLMPLLRVLAGPDGQDTGCQHFELGDPDSVDISSLTILDIEDTWRARVSSDLLHAQQRCVNALRQLGAQVRTVRFDGFAPALDIWSAMLTAAGGPSYATLLGNGTPVSSSRQLMRWMTGRSPHTLPSIIMTLLEHYPKLAPQRSQRFIDLGIALRRTLVDLIGPRGVLLYPSHRYPAPLHFRPLTVPFNFLYTAIFNVMELPVTQVPLGLNTQGLPLGIQVAALHGHDHLTIAVAMALEKEFGGWTPPAVRSSVRTASSQ